MAQRPDRSSEIERHAAKLEKDPQSRVFAQLADAYRKEGLLDEAIRICRDGLVAHPNYVSGRVVLGRALLEQGALEEAEAEFRRVLELAPDNLLALRLLGDTSAQQGRSGEAREHYERALRLNPLDRETQDRLAALPIEATPAPAVEPASVGLEPEAFAPPAMAGAGDEISLGEVEGGGPGERAEGVEVGAALSLEDAPAAVSPEESQRGSGPDLDPLASPTLAALYASQGHTDVAEKIYSQLDHGEPGAAPAVPEEVLAGAVPGPTFLERLLAFREAALRRRVLGREAGRES
ncbi:MAG: tetratricopeptide repeat protein [candidate division NC10 bacterium]|nr:tetratricopeptide repeat protein [candidate division NC10 bacterium]